MSAPADSFPVSVAFGAPSVTTSPDGAMKIVVPTDGERSDVAMAARLHRPGVVRDALMAMGDVLSSDLTRKATDRADYLAYLISRGKGVSKQVWDAQKEYLALQYSAAAKQSEPLEPVLTLAPDAMRFEVMSRDESTYAQLVLRRPAALVDAEHPGDQGSVRGTTYVDLAPALAAISRVRSYRPTTIHFAPSAHAGASSHAGAGAAAASATHAAASATLATGTGSHAAATAATRTKSVPLRWLRAFGQMQAASLIAADRFELSPIDLYNVLFSLRMRKARTAPRGLRYELVPGERPRLVLEPWDLVVHATGDVYRGAQPRVIRTWGRQRLNVLARILPHARKLTVAVAGPGLPSVYIVDLGDATLSLALSGWTDAGWAGIATFDALAAADDPSQIDAAVAALATPMTDTALATHLGRPRTDVRRTVLAALAQLRIGHDLATGELFARPLTRTPVPAASLTFRDAREAAAHRLLDEPGAVTLTKVHDQGADGRAIEGQVVDAKAHRTFYPSFTLDAEGRTSAATCTCSVVRRSGIKEGPCEHMIALRMRYAREQARLEAARATPEGRAMITAETRILMRRTSTGAETYRVSLDGRTVTTRLTLSGSDALATPRMQRLRFDSAPDARTAYFARLEDLSQKGYLDATQD